MKAPITQAKQKRLEQKERVCKSYQSMVKSGGDKTAIVDKIATDESISIAKVYKFTSDIRDVKLRGPYRKEANNERV